ncbi:MAG: hypothetical protein A2848_01775 [Candidatus Magasanikbacteria bacterium RIFCSPHIGHO2_01_FULL_50_8]|uniref:Uncharacterized protein n=1 Tax=Candidatus Magasanikbacteria bacterium RIFCSPHIGHO2_01_FULL_50_8 TaxID=1798674 RepID=A0A1F6LRQ6_9BACT|nr:MAG: hypothetical protein A2848_01775 [Candidatus Magasanikbacteria bacterium RIFCSPHIGHO2_01_FULL_50_8]
MATPSFPTQLPEQSVNSAHKQRYANWQATRHAAEFDSALINNQGADDAAEEDVEEFDDTAVLSDETEETGGDFGEGYDSATKVAKFFKERAIAWALGIFSPPGTGPLFGGGAALLQWQLRGDQTKKSDSSDDAS